MEEEKKKRNKGRDVHVFSHYLIAFLIVLVLKNPTVSSTTQEDDRVDSLPGMESFNVSFAHYSGYVTVDNVSGRSIFYWFFEAVEDPSSKPLVLWLNGGPGCSSMAFGVAEEIGPFHIKPDGKTLYLNPYSWNQVANLLFIDSPVGVGFSYSNNSWDIRTNGDARTAVDSLVFLKEWLKRFPEYEGRDFYITGESYAGHYIPQLAQAIVLSQQWMWKKSINLKGYMVGNALTDDYNDYLGLFEYWWTVGLISDETYKLLNLFCKHDSYLKPGPQCKKMHDVARQEMGNINIYSIDSPACTDNGTASNRLLKRLQLGALFSEQYDPCTANYSTVYFNLPEVQKALHVIPELAPTKWTPCSDVVSENWKDSATSVLDIYRQLIISGLRIWMFSGDTDARIPVTSTRYNIAALNLPKVSPWRAWYDGDQVGGWIQGYEGLTFVTVRGAGHKVPKFEPKLAFALFKAFLSGTTLPASTEDTTGPISGSQPIQLAKM